MPRYDQPAEKAHEPANEIARTGRSARSTSAPQIRQNRRGKRVIARRPSKQRAKGRLAQGRRVRAADVDVAAHRRRLQLDERAVFADRGVADLELGGRLAAHRPRVDPEPRAALDADADVARRRLDRHLAAADGLDPYVAGRRLDRRALSAEGAELDVTGGGLDDDVAAGVAGFEIAR